jgi:hypothetical protein
MKVKFISINAPDVLPSIKEIPAYFGMSVLAHFTEKNNIGIKDLGNIESKLNLTSCANLILEGVKEGYRKTKTKPSFELDKELIFDIMDDDKYFMQNAMSVFAQMISGPKEDVDTVDSEGK